MSRSFPVVALAIAALVVGAAAPEGVLSADSSPARSFSSATSPAIAGTDPPPTSPAATSSLSPGALYDAAYDRWKGLPRAPYVTYDASVLATIHGKVRERRYRIAFRASDRQCLITGVPIDARDRVDPPQVGDRCFGADFAFTFIPQKGGSDAIPLPIASEEPTPAASGAPRVIGSVSVRARPYAVSLVGDEDISGIRAAHLRLVPYRDPGHNVLRDLWIDRGDFAVVRLAGDAGFGIARVTFTVDYATRDGAGERFERLTGYGKAQILFAKIGADFHVDQDRYAFPTTLPSDTFDPKAKHASATAPPQTPQ
jgi:hypothetical protein